jgi:hypothetical protein
MKMRTTDATALTAKRGFDSFGSGNPEVLEAEQKAFGSFGSPNPGAHSTRYETADITKMAGTLGITVHILALTDGGIQCATPSAPKQPFWLPRGGKCATWMRPPIVGQLGTAIVPSWLAAKHRQLVGDVAFERMRRERGVEFAKPLTREPMEATMAEQQKDLTGALFRIDEDRRKNDNWPTHDGYVVVGGKKLYLSAWVRTSKDGKKYFSLALKPAEEKNGAPARPAAKVEEDPDIPFAPEWR